MIGPKQQTLATTRPAKDYYVREASGRRDAYYLVGLWGHYFGVEYTDSRLPNEIADVAGWTSEEDGVRALSVIADANPRGYDGTFAVGGGTIRLLDGESVGEWVPNGRFDMGALAGDLNAYFCFGAVDPEWRGRGIGREMFERRLRWASEQGADMAFGLGWERREGPTSRPLFEGYGFVPIQQFPDYYAEERPSCPDCSIWPSDENPCACEMTLWARELSYPSNGGDDQ